MDRDRLYNILGWGAFAFACSVFLLPLLNPDIYWHLSAGKYAVAHRGPPRTDFLSWPMAGKEWVDFEWLPQVFYYLLYELGGVRALQLFKVLLLVLTLLSLRATALLYGRRAILPLLLPFFAIGIMANCDLRPENFTLLFFTLTLFFLEKSRLNGLPRGARAYAAVFGFFALWANLHAGYLYGLALIGLYAGGEFFTEQLPYIYGKAPFARPDKSLRYFKIFITGLAASFINPYGWKIYSVILNHQHYITDLQDHIQEWSSFTIMNAYQWPYALALLAVMSAFAYFLLRRRYIVYPHFAALLFFAWASSNHQRHIPFFIITGLSFALALPWEKPGPAARAWLGGAGAVLAAGMIWFYAVFVWPQYSAKPLTARWGSEGLAGFLRSNRAELSGMRLYNNWGWGGWLGWEFAPEYKPFIDGRYLFHDKIGEVTGLGTDARKWKSLIETYKFDLMLLKLGEPPVPVKQKMAGGEEAVFWRPAYLFYLPRAEWAVVYWDYVSAVVARRSAVPAAWLEAHELRYLRPGDLANLPAPLLEGQIPLSELRRELRIFVKDRPGAENKSVSSDVVNFVKELETLCRQKGTACAK